MIPFLCISFPSMLQSFTSTGDTLDAVGLGFLAYELANPSDPADDELIIRAVNEHASLLTGLDFDNLIGASINEKLPSVRAAGLSPIYARVARSGVSETIEQVRLTIEPMAGQIFRVKVLGLAPNIGGLVFDNITERVLAAERIRFQSRLLDAVEQVVIATDAEGRVTYWNPAAERLFRVPAEQAVGAIIWEISLTPEQSRRLTESVLRGEKIAGSFTTQVRGGETIVVQVTASPFRGPQDEVAGMVLVAVDVTARVHAEETVRENERRMRALVKALPDAVLRLSRAGIVIEASRPLDGISYPNPVGTDVRIAAMEFLSPAHGAAIHAALDRALAGKSVQTVEFDITHAGATHHLEARLVADGEDDIVAILRNVTQRRRMELQLLASRNDLEWRVQARTAELRQVNEALRTLIDGSPFAIASCDAEGRLRSWNRAAERMFGYTAAEVMGLVVPILPEAEQEAFLERVRKLLDDPAEQIDVLDRVYRHKNGS
ncbi:MAG: PAS domain-containing protein, partial [Thermoanaerobaculia bacterium]